MSRVGEHIGNYELVAILGGGGFADVFRARHTILGTEFALKVLHASEAARDEVRARFRREARLQHIYPHPHIVRVSEVFDEPGLAVMVLELVDGPDLATAIDGEWEGPWLLRDAWLLMRPVLEALAFAHGHGVVHRDLKPENILLERRDGPWPPVPKVTDFGIAKVVGGDDLQTRTQARMGTPVYSAPEQMSGGAANVTTSADVYSLGMLFWRLLAGRLPVDIDDELAVVELRVGHRRSPPLGEVLPRLDPAVAALVDRCLSIDPTERPRDAGVLLDVLKAYMDPSRLIGRVCWALVDGMVEAKVVEWLIEPGQVVDAGDHLVKVATSAGTVNVTCPLAGRVLSHAVRPGETVRVSQILCVLENQAATGFEAEWFVAIKGHRHGPMSLAALVTLAEDGSVGESNYAWRPGMVEWLRVRDIAELKDVLRVS